MIMEGADVGALARGLAHPVTSTLDERQLEDGRSKRGRSC